MKLEMIGPTFSSFNATFAKDYYGQCSLKNGYVWVKVLS